jgi:hypothetical protein
VHWNNQFDLKICSLTTEFVKTKFQSNFSFCVIITALISIEILINLKLSVAQKWRRTWVVNLFDFIYFSPYYHLCLQVLWMWQHSDIFRTVSFRTFYVLNKCFRILWKSRTRSSSRFLFKYLLGRSNQCDTSWRDQPYIKCRKKSSFQNLVKVFFQLKMVLSDLKIESNMQKFF